jgi:TRAP-type mannitol/chloroaromatic compound transport system permease small subunit
MGSLLRLSRAIDAINAVAARIADWMVLLAVLISAGNAATRYLFNYSSNSFLEIQWYLFGGIVFLGASYTLKVNQHVRVDIVYSAVSDRGRLLIDIFGLALFLLPATILLAWLSWPVFVNALSIGETSASFGGLIRWPILLVLPVGFALLTLQGVSELIKRIAALSGAGATVAEYSQPQQ